MNLYFPVGVTIVYLFSYDTSNYLFLCIITIITTSLHIYRCNHLALRNATWHYTADWINHIKATWHATLSNFAIPKLKNLLPVGIEPWSILPFNMLSTTRPKWFLWYYLKNKFNKALNLFSITHNQLTFNTVS